MQLMLQSPATVGDPSPQFVDMDDQRPFLHDLTDQHAVQLIGNVASDYDSEFMTQTTTAFDSPLAESEMVASGTDMGLSDFGFPSLDVNMTEDRMTMPDVLSTISTDIADLLY